MISLPGYQIKEKLYESQNTYVFQAIDEIRKCPVILKILKGDYPKTETIARFKREYEILRDLNIDGVIKVYSLEKYKRSFVIIMEDLGAESLEKILKGRKLNIAKFLDLAIKIAEILGKIHQRNIIHKDINPSNIIWNPETNELKIIDFGISTVLPREIAAAQSPDVLEGTLAYMSPEKTGRMNRTMDYRTDLYSFGVSLYEMLTGQLPFPATDAMELIHCHIAKDPVPPYEALTSDQWKHENVGLLSKIILRLMAKDAEDRYQSAFGLKADLENCMEQLHTSGKIKDFEIAQQDFSDKFQIPQKLYGREKEIEILLNSFNRVCRGTKEMMMVIGYAGIGKSVLVNEVHKYIIAKHGYFISGKFNQFKRNIPYFGLIQAFQQLIRQILTEKEERILEWKEKILDAVGPNGQVIIDVIPEVELVIGKQPPVPELPSQESQNRFNLYFQNFIRAFSSEKHPLIIFMDDLQWVDLPSLKSIRLFMSDNETKYMFFIGAYRNNEIEPNHPLLKTLDEIMKAGTTMCSLILPSLDYDNVNLMIAETLKCPVEKTVELAKLCKKKTLGNPFFLKQFLQTLFKENLFEFDNRQRIWCWEIDKIGGMGITDNVVDLMVKKIQKLPEKTQAVLKLATCIGTQFDLKTLALVNEKTPAETATDLWDALPEEFVLPISDAYKFIQKDFDDAEVVYKFSHDRIQQAVHSMMDEYQKKEYHLGIGRILLTNTSTEKLDEEIFEIVNHLNSGIDLIVDLSEKHNLSRLNLIAGKKAKSATAYEPALGYLTTGIELLGKDSWEFQYSLTLSLFIEIAEVSFLTGDYEKMNGIVKISLDHTKILLDRIKIYEIIIQSLIARAKLPEALNTSIEILKQLGVNISKKPTKTHVIINLLRVQAILFTRDLEDLKKLPEMSDPNALAAMRILMSAASSAYRRDFLMVTIMLLKMVQLSVRYGNSPFSPFGYSMYAVFLLGVIGNINKGYKFGKFPIELITASKTKEYIPKINILFNLFIRHWKDPLKETIEPLFEGFHISLESGDLEFASYSLMYSCVHSLFCGKNLESVNKELGEYIEVIKKLKQERTLINVKFHKQFTSNLMGYAKDRTMLIGDSFNEEEILPSLISDNDMPSLGSYNASKTIICYIFGKEKESLQYALESERYKKSVIGLIYFPLIYFYTSLVFLSQMHNTSWLKRIQYHIKIYKNQRVMKKLAKHAPVNHLQRWYLVEAERFRVLKKDMKAIKCYDKAINLAHQNNYIIEEALANELAAKYFYKTGNRKIARTYMIEASHLYKKWGAKAKVDHLNENYSRLLYTTSEETRKENDYYDYFEESRIISSDKLDMKCIQQASQAISSEIHLDRLLEKLMNIVIANAGAQKGFLLLLDEEELYLEGEALANNKEVTVLQHIPLVKVEDISQVIVNYVFRVNETVVINDAGNEKRFANDDYIIKNRPKSILCMPLIHQNKLSGIVYLENNIAIGAFTPERLEILEMLTGEIVISIENAKLYKNLEAYNQTLEEKVARRTAEISQKNEQLNVQKEELGAALENLRQSQYQLIQSEKLASLGHLVAGIAHEINNPVNFISVGVDSLSTNLDEIEQVLDIYHEISPANVEEKLKEIEVLKEKVEYREALSEIEKLIESIKNGTKRTTEIVKGLRTFSRLDEDIIKTADIHEGLDSTLILLHNKYKNRIEIKKIYGDIPQIECYPGQLNQVFMNILSNAIDAIENTGTITITTFKINGQIKISIKDTGRGIPEEFKERIFEPFFTSKEIGKGTGLGLSISHGIIEKLKGSIEVRSNVEKGSEFIIVLPITQAKK